MAMLEFSSAQKSVLAISSILLVMGGGILIGVKPDPERENNVRNVAMDKLDIAFNGESTSKPQEIKELSPEEQAYQRELLKVELNNAAADELVKIKGVGPSMAKKIIDYRSKTPFKSVEDLRNITGVGEKTFQKLSSHVRVGNPGENTYVANKNGSASSGGGSELININTATEKELTRLPRVGPSTAKNIIRYREKNGEFKRKTDLMNVPRIGDKTYSNIKNLITVESSRRNYKKSRTKKSGIKKPSAKRRASTKSGNKININTASAGKLSKLPRISAKTADRIIQYRNKHGKFKTIKDLKEVRGIGIATFNNIRNMITVE